MLSSGDDSTSRSASDGRPERRLDRGLVARPDVNDALRFTRVDQELLGGQHLHVVVTGDSSVPRATRAGARRPHTESIRTRPRRVEGRDKQIAERVTEKSSSRALGRYVSTSSKVTRSSGMAPVCPRSRTGAPTARPDGQLQRGWGCPVVRPCVGRRRTGAGVKRPVAGAPWPLRRTPLLPLTIGLGRASSDRSGPGW